ncbi:MAG: hypothetical protein ACWA6X_08630 [Bauldia sp.]|jgi:hypothetical protein
MTKYLAGVAGIAVLALTTTAQAADVMPVVVPQVVTPVVVAPAGPDFGIEISAYATATFPFADPWSVGVDLDIVTHFIGARGFGFRLEGGTGIEVYPGFGNGGFGGDLEVFKQFGNFEVGAMLQGGGGFPIGSVGFAEAGPYVRYSMEHGMLTLDQTFSFLFPVVSMGNRYFSSETEVTVDVNDNLELTADFQLDRPLGGPFFAYLSLGAAYTMGPLTPYAELQISFGDPMRIILGADFERQIGTGPLSLIGNAQLQLSPTYREASVSVGIRFSRGNTD